MSDDGILDVWLHDHIVCIVCGYDWIAVYPSCATRLECKKCGFMNDAPAPKPEPPQCVVCGERPDVMLKSEWYCDSCYQIVTYGFANGV